MLKDYLKQEIPIHPLALFRMLFGLMLFLESVGAIFTGWVKRTFIDTEFTFTFIGFEFLQAPDGYFIYFYYTLMGSMGLLVMLGYYYRISLSVFTIMWTTVYLMQKSNYNNHYYLLILLCVVMILLPAERAYSFDSKRKSDLKSMCYLQFHRWIIILQVWIVYTFASVAKMNQDWIAGKPIAIWFRHKSDYWLIGDLLQQEWFQTIVVFGGIFFDLLIIPLLLYKRTRVPAFFVGVFFHLFNSAVFQIGIFPFLMIALCLFFFPGEKIAEWFFKAKSLPKKKDYTVYSIPRLLVVGLIIYFSIQVYLPLRHHRFASDVNCSEEGHRMAWRMMLRSKSGIIKFIVKDSSGNKEIIQPIKYMTYDQYKSMAARPDMIWQFAQRIKDIKAAEGKSVQVFAKATVSLNAGKRVPFIDESVDLASEDWDRFKHKSWILPCR